MATVYKSFWNGDSVNKTHLEAGSTAVLCEAESRHLVKVFRAREGDAVLLFNAEGDLWQGELLRADGRAAQVRILLHKKVSAPCPYITLAQAMPKGKTMDSVIAAMVELGVARIAPLATDHSEVRLEKDPSRAESKREHWQQTAIEAAKQSSNFYGTQVLPITPLKVFLDSLPPLTEQMAGGGDASSSAGGSAVPSCGAVGQGDLPAQNAEAVSTPSGDSLASACGNIVAAGGDFTSTSDNRAAATGDLRIIGSLEEGSVPLAALAGDIALAERVTCLIGPEGDFSPAEYALARAHGFRPVRLAAHVLRVKTAATYIASTVDALARAGR